MTDAFRTKVIRTLIDEIALLTGGRFEQFGYRMMAVIHPAQWIERGTTVEGAPRGYTVDTSAEGSALVAEMSSEGNYFQDDMEKPRRDLIHALDLHSDVKRIWLQSSREAAAGETTKCADLITEFKNLHQSIEHIEILDSRKIAEYIYEHLDMDRFVYNLSGYLPSLGRLADENAFSHHIPIYPDYQPRPDFEQDVVTRLRDESWVVISGISGAGKSALAAQIAQTLDRDFDLVIWLDAHSLERVEDLSDVDVLRTGVRHNITSLLCRHKCLLILDDARYDIRKIESRESKVIVTCQATSDPRRIAVGDLDRDSARNLLEVGVPTSCPNDIFQRVFSNVGGYPLLLGALNRLAKEEGWNAVSDCCEEAVSSIEDERHDKVCQRILMRHRESLAAELEFVKWCDSPRFNSELSAICVSTRAVSNLQKRGFLSAATSGVIRVHDVVYQAICAVINVCEQRKVAFCEKLGAFIQAECENEKGILRHIVSLHTPLLQRLLRSNPCPSFVYAVALARTGDTPLDLFGSLCETATTVAAYDNWLGREIEVRAVIEAIEAIYTIKSVQHGGEAARESLRENINALVIIRNSSSANSELLRDIKHHYAKMLFRLKNLSEAESEFMAILTDYPNYAAGRLQLARIMGQTHREPEALDECRKIINQHKESQSQISTPILLEALRLVATIGSLEDLRLYEELIISCLSAAREIDSALALRLISVVTHKTCYIMPELASRLFDTIEWGCVVPNSVDERFDWAQAHKAAAKAIKGDESRKRKLLNAADDTYKSISRPSRFHIIQHAEALIILNYFEEANDLLERVPDGERNSFWGQRKTQALLGLGRVDEALEVINNVLLNIESKDQKYKSAFLHDRYKVRAALSDPEAIEDIRMAINLLSPEDKYRKELELELNDIIGLPKPQVVLVDSLPASL